MRHKKGDRVGAILCGEEEGGKKLLKFLGYGVYDGDEVPPKGGGFMQDAMNETGNTNPKIVLDNGKVVWGCQCWWGSEAAVRKQIEEYEKHGYETVVVDMEEEMLKEVKKSEKAERN